MKLYFFLFGCLGIISVHAQTNPFNDLKGNWQERARLDKNGDYSEFTDTLRMDFAGEGLCVMRYGKAESIVGAGELDGEKFRFKGKTYTLKIQNLSEFELRNGEVRHTLKRVGQYGGGTPKAKLYRGDMSGEEGGEVKTDEASWNGKWTCYRKTDPGFSSTKFYIKHLDISANNRWGGKVTWQNMDSVFTADMMVQVKGREMELKGQDATEKFSVLKADGQEMILKRGEEVYYLKRFSKK